MLDEKLNLELQLQAAEVNGDGKVISSPRVVTLDNSKATIEQGVSIPFQTFENGDAQLEFVDAVLKLDVTPHITADKSDHHEGQGEPERAGRLGLHADGFARHLEEPGRYGDAGEGRPDARRRWHLRHRQGRAAVARAVPAFDPDHRDGLFRSDEVSDSARSC